MTVSIIIPTYNEEANIGNLVCYLLKYGTAFLQEVLVSDGGSADKTPEIAAAAGAVVLHCPCKGRAAQMNQGAREAKGDILYFLHADAFPPPSFLEDITGAVKLGYGFGNFRQEILSDKPLVKINNWASRFNRLISSGGDQSLFIRRELFEELEGYREDFIIMEDYEFFKRAKRKSQPIKIPKNLKVLDRKYRYNSFIRVNLSNAAIFSMYSCGIHPSRLYPLYKKWIRGPRYSGMEEGKG